MTGGSGLEKQTVLVVDDEAFFRQMFMDLLGEEGYRLECYGSGEEALVRLNEGGVDLVLTDMVMPGTSGLDILQLSRSLPNPPEVILVTGHASLETAIQALKNGARDYLAKPFDQEELRHLVATTLEQRRLLEENQLLKKNIRLFQAGQSLASVLAVEPLMRQAVTVLVRELGGGWGLGLLCDGEEPLRYPAVQAMTGQQAKSLAEAVRPTLQKVEDRSLVPLHLPEGAWTKLKMEAPGQLYLIPLRSHGDVKGGLLIAGPASQEGGLSQQDFHYLAEETAIGFDNAYRYEHARELMYTDDLTGLYNHRYLHIALDKEIRRSKRYDLKFSLVFIDLDRFKQVNDRHGHLAGSAVLSEVGNLLKQCARDADILCRFGGDEFAILLLETDAAGAKIVTERMRSVIEGHVFLENRGPACRVTATVGYATFPIDASDQQGLLDLADQAMYAGKRSRNVICGPDEVKNPSAPSNPPAE